jgi:peptidoglycan-associated lipoprotein
VEAKANEGSASKPIEELRKAVIHFPFDRATPVAADMPLLAAVTDLLLARPEVAVDIEGHTCRLGSEGYNDQLGQRRAEAIRKYLVETGVAARQVSRQSSYGEHRPVCPEPSEDCLRRNRRAVLLLVKSQEN